MNYMYYPGCSLTASAREYDLSTRAIMTAAGVRLSEVDGWTCCGASAAAPISDLLSLSLGARNLALAEQKAVDGEILVPCSACYLNLKKAQDALLNDDKARSTINDALAAVELTATGSVRVRHLLDVLTVDITAQRLTPLMTRSLSGLTVAPYYGCQCLRPYREFDDPERPVSMEPLIEATGAAVHTWEMGARCCGASLVSTQPNTGARAGMRDSESGQGCRPHRYRVPDVPDKSGRLAGQSLPHGRRGLVHQRAISASAAGSGDGNRPT
jgi:heterodisulfide reductase subunit B